MVGLPPTMVNMKSVPLSQRRVPSSAHSSTVSPNRPAMPGLSEPEDCVSSSRRAVDSSSSRFRAAARTE